jgi:16S rRNA (guanine966-N2)-methyltransferase
MRIVAGDKRGRRLRTPGKHSGIRPTSEALREALFSILGARVASGPFVDLCAGTGAVGLEALSRGAPQAFLIEQGREALRLCAANIDALGVGPTVQLRSVSAEHPGKLPPVAVAFADPPYTADPQQALGWLLAIPLLDDGCWVLELDSGAHKPRPPVGVAVVFDRVYGGSRLLIFEPDSEAE